MNIRSDNFSHLAGKTQTAPNLARHWGNIASPLSSENFWGLLSFLSEGSVFNTLAGECKNTAIAEKREETPEMLTKVVSKMLARKFAEFNPLTFNNQLMQSMSPRIWCKYLGVQGTDGQARAKQS